jgi:hypothetical protein
VELMPHWKLAVCSVHPEAQGQQRKLPVGHCLRAEASEEHVVGSALIQLYGGQADLNPQAGNR